MMREVKKLVDECEKQPGIVAILGTGVWGSTLSKLVKRNQHQVRFWSRSSGVTLAETITRIYLQ